MEYCLNLKFHYFTMLLWGIKFVIQLNLEDFHFAIMLIVSNQCINMMLGPIVDYPTSFTMITLFLVAKQTISPELDPKVHRLQRQDVRSRKTFKRRKATKAPSMKRLGGHGYLEDTSEGEAGSSESSPARRAYSMRRTNHDTLTSYRDRSAYVREISRSHQGFTSHPGFPELSRLGNTRSSWGSGTATERNRTQHQRGQGQSEHGPQGEEEIKVPLIYCSTWCMPTEWTGIFLSMLWNYVS